MKQILNLWSACNRIIPIDSRDFVQRSLESGTQLQWKARLKEVAQTLNSTVGLEIWKPLKTNFLEKEIVLMCKGNLNDDCVLDLCHMAALIACDRIGEE